MESINLNRARKARTKDDQAATAQSNRVRFGRTKAEKLADAARAEKALRDHEGKKREP